MLSDENNSLTVMTGSAALHRNSLNSANECHVSLIAEKWLRSLPCPCFSGNFSCVDGEKNSFQGAAFCLAEVEENGRVCFLHVQAEADFPASISSNSFTHISSHHFILLS